MVKACPTVKLNNGKDLPVLGLGTWKVSAPTRSVASNHPVNTKTSP